MSLLLPILATALGRLGQTAIIDDRRQYTYAQLLGGSMFLAEKIEQATTAPNVGILLPTSGMVPMAILGAWLARRACVPFNFLLNREELAYVIADSQVDTIITAGPLLTFMGGRDKLPANIRLLLLEDLDFSGMPPFRWPPLLANDSTAVILYTSGTSGRPKGVALSHANIQSNAEAAIVHAGITRADTFLGVLPQFHCFGLTDLTLVPLRIGAKVVYAARFTPRRLIELIRKHEVDIFLAVPSMYGAMLTVKDAGPEDFKSIRLAVSGGEALPATLAHDFLERFGVQLYEGYGLTETSPATHWSTPWNFKPGSVGTPLPGVVTLIVDDRDQILPPDQEGEILLAGPNIMKGYYRKPEETAGVITTLDIPGLGPTRCFRTGDIGRVDADGSLYITGRKKEIFKVAGEMVSPREVEDALAQHPSVKAAAVAPKRDEMRGEVPVAFVEIQEGQAFDETALRAWCRERLAGYKVPREIHQLESLPRNATGKLMRRQLKVD